MFEVMLSRNYLVNLKNNFFLKGSSFPKNNFKLGQNLIFNIKNHNNSEFLEQPDCYND